MVISYRDLCNRAFLIALMKQVSFITISIIDAKMFALMTIAPTILQESALIAMEDALLECIKYKVSSNVSRIAPFPRLNQQIQQNCSMIPQI